MADDRAKPQSSLVMAPRFDRNKRRLPAKARLACDDAVKKITEDPLAGELKVGALRMVRVMKCKVGPLQLLLAYTFHERRNAVELLAVAPHENFYRDLQDDLESR